MATKSKTARFLVVGIVEPREGVSPRKTEAGKTVKITVSAPGAARAKRLANSALWRKHKITTADLAGLTVTNKATNEVFVWEHTGDDSLESAESEAIEASVDESEAEATV